MNYSYNTTNKANTAYSNLINGKVDEDLTFRKFRATANEVYKAVEQRKSDVKAEEARIKERYSNNVAMEKLAQLHSVKKDYIKSVRSRLIDKLDEVYKAKSARLTEFVMTPPTDEMTRLLTTVNLRGGKVSEAELEMLVEATAGNYQALSTVHSFAEANGMTFVMPINPAEYSDELERVYNDCKERINRLGNDDVEYKTLEMFCYTNDTDNGYFTQTLNRLDNDIAFAIEKPELTRMQVLEEELGKAYGDKDYGKYVRIRTLIENKGDEIKTEAERDSDLQREIDNAIKSHRIEVDNE